MIRNRVDNYIDGYVATTNTPSMEGQQVPSTPGPNSVTEITGVSNKFNKLGIHFDKSYNSIQTRPQSRNSDAHHYKIDDEVGKPLKEVSNTKIQDLNHKLRSSTQQIIGQCKVIKDLKTKVDEQGTTIENLKSR